VSSVVRLGVAVFVAVVGSGTLLASRPQYRSPATSQEDIEAAIRAVQAQMQRAAERLDAPALYAHVVDGPTPPVIENGQLADTRVAALARTAQGFQALTSVSYTYTRQSITVLSATTALWIGVGTASAVLADGRTIDAPFAESIVFVERDGQWMVLHAHRSGPRRP
jgi:ketosteroid isomerase-like protein